MHYEVCIRLVPVLRSSTMNIIITYCVQVPRPSLAPVFDRLQYAKTGAGEGLGMRLITSAQKQCNEYCRADQGAL